VSSAPVTCVPLTALAPFQPPDAVHAVALVALQVNVAESPLLMAEDVDVNVSTGAGVAAGAEVSTGAEFVGTPLPHAVKLSAAAAQIKPSSRITSRELSKILTSWRIHCI
jgi:hypothetical protein